MKRLIHIVYAGVALAALNGCGGGDGGDDPQEIVEEVTTVDAVAFEDLLDHRITIRERHSNSADENEIVFCEDNKVRSGSFKNGDYDASAPTVTMTFDSAGETLSEEDSDATFKHDDHVQFNGSDYIITAIQTAPFAVCN